MNLASWRAPLHRIACAGGIAAALALSAPAQTSVDLDEARVLAFQLVADGQYEAAAALARTILEGAPKDQAAYLALAQAERGAGRTEAAVKAARSAWRYSDTQSEKYASSVVAAQALSSDGKPLRAQFWLRRAAQNAPNPVFEARAKRDFAYLRSVTPQRVDLRFSVAPSSNINNGSKSETVEVAGLPFAIAGDARALSGVEYAMGATLSYRLPQQGQWSVTASAALDAKFYTLSSKAERTAPNVSGSDYAFQELGFRLNARRADKDGQGATLLSARVGQNWYGGSTLTRFASVGAGRQYQIGERSALSVNLNAERQWRLDNDLRSADVITLDGTWSHQFDSGARVWVTGYTSDTASDSSLIARETMGASMTYAFGAPVFAKTDLQLSLGLQASDYDRPLALFGLREDDTISASATMIFNDLSYYGFSPSATLEVQHTSSTLDQYDTEDIGLKLGLRSNF